MSCLRRSLDGDNADQVRIRLLDHDQEQYRDRDELLDEALDDVLTHEDLQHTIGSFSAIVLPVTITMILASMATCFIKDPTSAAALADAYLVYRPGQSTSSERVQFEQAAINAIVIVLCFILVTFGIVLCYKFNCSRILTMYMILSSVMLLGFLGSNFLLLILTLWHIVLDEFTFLTLAYNFTVVGVISIFYQIGVPIQSTQMYLILTSVILAWRFGQLPEWTTWALVITLAFYDLCAVLSPIGPLRCLVQLVEREGRPLPGLLYEADIRQFHVTEQGEKKEDRVTVVTSTYYQSDRIIREPDQKKNLIRERLILFFKRVDPDGIIHVDHLMSKYESNETGLWKSLQKKYCDEDNDSIKLGLGDFVFYSVLVSRAARFDVTAMIGCITGILMGLGGTLFLLGIYRKALPALPISILTAVVIYFWQRFVFIPYADDMLYNGIL